MKCIIFKGPPALFLDYWGLLVGCDRDGRISTVAAAGHPEFSEPFQKALMQARLT